MHLLDEVAQHPLGDVEVGDDTVLQRPDRHDVARRPADHPFRLDTDRDDLAGIGIECHHRRFIQRDPPPADVHQGVRGTEVDRHVTAEERQHAAHDKRAFSRNYLLMTLNADTGRGRGGTGHSPAAAER